MDTKHPGSGIKPIEIFRAGTFTAMNGQPYTFTPQSVQELAETYNPGFADAPLVVGHPKLNSPRFGRASRLFINDAGILCAEADEVVPEFAEAVNAKLYPKVSASIYLPDAPGNPTPGKHYLRHIGFLGGTPPAVKGLKSVEFAADETGIVNFSYEDRVVVGIFRRLRDWFVATYGIDTAQNLIPDYQLDGLQEDAVRDDMSDAANPLPAFSSPNPQQKETEVDPTKAALDAQAASLAQKEQALRAREAELVAREATVKKADHADFAESLVVGGRLLPAQKDDVVEILAQLDAAKQVASFAEGHANHGKTGADLFRAFLSAQPKQVEFGRVSQQPRGESGGSADFAAPMGYDVDPAGLETMRKAEAYMKEHPGTDFVAAVKAVS